MKKQQSSERLRRKKEDLANLDKAYYAIISGAQSYSLGSRSVTKAQLSTIIEERKRLEDEIESLENPGGRFRRVVPIDR